MMIMTLMSKGIQEYTISRFEIFLRHSNNVGSILNMSGQCAWPGLQLNYFLHIDLTYYALIQHFYYFLEDHEIVYTWKKTSRERTGSNRVQVQLLKDGDREEWSVVYMPKLNA